MMGKRGALSVQEIENIKDLRNQGLKLRYIVWKTGRDAKTVIKYGGPKRTHKPWTMEEFQRALSLKTFGFTNKEIGEQIGRSTAAVSVALYNYQKKNMRKRDGNE